MNKTKKLSLATVKAELNIAEMVEIQAGSGCGGDVAACMSYIYSGMGWLSVATMVATGYCPVVSIAAAATCALHNC